jgi:prolyl oligopeptidase
MHAQMKIKYLTIPGILAFTIWMSCADRQENRTAMPYPETKRVDSVDNYFGVSVADPYRWLENDTTQETAAWVEAQN